MRLDMDPTALTLLGKQSGQALLCAMQLSQPVCVCTAAIDLDWDGNTYIGGRGVAVDSVKDQGGEMQKLQFSLSGVPSEYVSLALSEPIQGKRITLSLAILDPDTHAILDVVTLWAGTLDQMPVKYGTQAATISVTAEHRGIAYSRPKGVRYTDADQQRLYPGDRCLEYLVAQSTHQDTWPSASFFKQ